MLNPRLSSLLRAVSSSKYELTLQETAPRHAVHRYKQHPMLKDIASIAAVTARVQTSGNGTPSSAVKRLQVAAFGTRWGYVEFARPPNNVLKAWSEPENPTYGTKRVPIPEMVELSPVTPELLDHMGRLAQAFEIIARRTKNREMGMWNL
ncbi:hypothetical protein DFH29DRAFT_1066117 [Suillus ampliporus]|nr:hypothetical protein DFH29DRAFT_1066117 [Suillus ampliporus]